MFDLTRLLNVLSSRGGVPAGFQRMLQWKLLRGSQRFEDIRKRMHLPMRAEGSIAP